MRGASTTDATALNRRAMAVALVFACTQDALFALVFLTSMNHYLLDVLKTGAGAPGYALALYGGIKLVTHPAGGRLLDRTSPRFVFLLAIASQLVGLALYVLIPGLWVFLLATVLLAIGAAAMWPLIYETVSRTQPVEVHARAGGILSLAGYIATGAGLAIGVLLSGPATPWRIAVLAGMVIVGSSLLAEGEPALHRRERASATPEPHARPSNRTAELVLFSIVIFLDYLVIASVAAIYGPYVRLTLHITLLKTTLLLIPTGILALLALMVASRISRPNRRFVELAVCFVIAAAGALALASTDSEWAAAGYAVLAGIGLGATAPIIAAAMLDLGGLKGPGFVIGSLMAVEGIGSIVGPAVTGGVAEFAGPRAALAFIGIVLVVLVPVSLFAAHPPRRWATPRAEGYAPAE